MLFITQCSLSLLPVPVSLVSDVQVCRSVLLRRNSRNTVFGSAEIGSSWRFCCHVSHHQLTVTLPLLSPFPTHNPTLLRLSFHLSVQPHSPTVRRRVRSDLSFSGRRRRRRRKDWPRFLSLLEPWLLQSYMESWNSSDALVAAATARFRLAFRLPGDADTFCRRDDGGMLPLPPI